MNKILKAAQIKKRKPKAVYKTFDTLTNNATETLEVMLETHFKDDPVSTNNATHTHVLRPKTLVDKIYDPKRLDEAVNSFDPEKAAGPDSIKPIILQKSWNLIKSFTRSIMTRSHELQHIPSPWTESKGIFLPKPGGGGGGGGLTQKCRTCMGVGGCFRDPKHKSNMYTFVQQRGVSIFYPKSQKYEWYFCTHIS